MSNELLVIKIGGGADLDHAALWDDLAALHAQGRRFILVHGGNATLTAFQERLGSPPRFVENAQGAVSRYTDRDTMDLFTMVYSGKLNADHVCGLRARGVDAVGLTGIDGGLITAERRPVLRCIEEGKKKVLRDDHTGSIVSVNGDLLQLLLAQGYTPVVTVPAYAEGPQGAGGVAVNVDGDTAALRIATALHATTLLYLSDVPGLLGDPEDDTTLIARVDTPARWSSAKDAAKGRFRRKLEAVREAVAQGVGTVVIAAGTIQRPVQSALAGGGTHFTDIGTADPSIEEAVA